MKHSISPLRRSLIIVFAGAAMLACRTTTFVPGDVSVPQDLTGAQVEASILAAVLELPSPSLTPSQARGGSLSEDTVRTLFGEGYNQPARFRSSRWLVRDRKPGSMTAELRVRDHFLAVGIDYDTSDVRTRVIRSENLLQDGDEIHSRAIGWIRELETRINLSMATLPR